MAHPARRLGLWSAVFLALMGVCASAMAASVTIERIVAKVNDEIIMLSELQDAVKPRVEQLRKNFRGDELNRRIREVEIETLDAMIETRLILKRAAALSAEVSEKELENTIQELLRKNQLTTDGLRRFLSAQGTTLEKYRQEMRRQILARKIERLEVGGHVTVGEQEIAHYHRTHSDEYRENESRVVRQIFFPITSGAPAGDVAAQREKAARAYEAATKPGADFSKVAREYSEGPAREQGGLLGALKKGEVFPEFEQLVFSTGEGQTSRPTKTRVGYHIVHVDKVNPGKLIPLDRVAGKIRSRMLREKFVKRRREWVADLKRSAFLEISYDPGPLGDGLSSVSRDVREQVAFRLVGVRINKGGGLFGRERIVWAYGANRSKPRWKSTNLKVGPELNLTEGDIGTLEPTHRLFINPDPSAFIYLFRHRYLFPDSYMGKISLADMIKAFSLEPGPGEKKKFTFDTDTRTAQLEFEVDVRKTRSIVADPKEITK